MALLHPEGWPGRKLTVGVLWMMVEEGYSTPFGGTVLLHELMRSGAL